MDKTIVGLIGAVGALAAASPSQAASNPAPRLDEAMHAASYADLLKPIPNAAALLSASDAALTQAPSATADVMQVQYYYHHHHHHHHRYYRRPVYHHHHHHHHRNAIVIPLPR